MAGERTGRPARRSAGPPTLGEDPAAKPWVMGSIPTNDVEGRISAEYLKQRKPLGEGRATRTEGGWTGVQAVPDRRKAELVGR